MPDLTTEDRLAIGEIVARYCHAIDRGRWDDLPGLFTPDGTLDLQPLMGRFEGAAGIRSFCEMMRPLPIVMRHLVTNLVLCADGEGRARGESYVLAITNPDGPTPQQMTGFYDDVFARTPAGWRLSSRRILPDVPKS